MLLLPLLTLLAASAASPTSVPDYYNYTTITGYFLQDSPSTNASTFNYTTENFGLINRTYPADSKTKNSKSLTQWQRFANQVALLNSETGANAQYKVLFMGRHGEGYHNVAQTFYGTPAWNCYWSLQDGNGTVTWADAKLTPNGIAQAQTAHDFWAHEIAVQKIPTPESYYTSPLTRCLQTSNITFSGLDLPKRSPFIPTIKELMREVLDAHTCDRRSTKTEIHNNFTSYLFEQNFAENDPLWNETYAETADAEDIRSKALLDNIFSTDSNTYLSFTSHSGEIGSILRVLGHQSFSLSTGAVIPVLVKQETIRGQPALMPWQPWSTFYECSTPPATTTNAVSATATASVNATTTGV